MNPETVGYCKGLENCSIVILFQSHDSHNPGTRDRLQARRTEFRFDMPYQKVTQNAKAAVERVLSLTPAGNFITIHFVEPLLPEI